MFNDSNGPAVMIEYQPVLRKEWLAPHPQMPPQPQSPQAAELPTDQVVALDFDVSSTGWAMQPSGARLKSLVGETIRANFWDLSRAGASVNIASQLSRRERIALVLNGTVTSVVGENRRDIGREVVVEVRPSARDVRLQ